MEEGQRKGRKYKCEVCECVYVSVCECVYVCGHMQL